MPSGPRPLHSSVRQRQNKSSTAAELPALSLEERSAIIVPELPAEKLWDPKTSDFWVSVWQSPMRLEWDPADLHKLTMVAYLLDEFYVTAADESLKRLDRAYALNKLAKSILDLTVRMGLDPFARRSLQWLLVQTEKDEAERDLSKAKTVTERAKAPRRASKGFDALQ